MNAKITIGAYEWNYKDNVKEMPHVEGDVKDNSECTLGLCDYGKLEIYIKKGMPPDLKKVTIVHELFHAFFASSGFDPKEEERVVDILSNQLVQFIKTNPKFFKDKILK